MGVHGGTLPRATSVDEIFRERTGARAAWSANLATAVVLLGVLYFAHGASFPRGLFVCGMVALLILTLFAHAIFRFVYRKKLGLGRPTRILLIGADQFAREAAIRLQRLSFAPCQVMGYVELPDQEVGVPAHSQVYSLDSVRSLHPGNGVDEVVMAIHPARFRRFPKS